MARLNLGKVLVTLEGEHDSSRSYDKYCEVTSGGSSYVSKKAVPIGTPITDTAFWQLRASKGADGTDGTNGNDGLDAYQPFKGWYSSTSELNTSFGTPQVGDYAYIKGATANDPVAIYQCVTAGSWTDSGRTFNPSNNQEFASGQSLNTVNIVDNLTSSSATDVLSAKQGKELKGQIDALGPKLGELDGEVNKTINGDSSLLTEVGTITAAAKIGGDNNFVNTGWVSTNGVDSVKLTVRASIANNDNYSVFVCRDANRNATYHITATGQTKQTYTINKSQWGNATEFVAICYNSSSYLEDFEIVINYSLPTHLTNIYNKFGKVDEKLSNKIVDWITGASFNLTTTPVAASPNTGSTSRCIQIPCSQGDTFVISGTGGAGTARLWAFLDSSRNILRVALPSASEVNTILIAPANAAYIIINQIASGNADCYAAYKHLDAMTHILGTIPDAIKYSYEYDSSILVSNKQIDYRGKDGGDSNFKNTGLRQFIGISELVVYSTGIPSNNTGYPLLVLFDKYKQVVGYITRPSDRNEVYVKCTDYPTAAYYIANAKTSNISAFYVIERRSKIVEAQAIAKTLFESFDNSNAYDIHDVYYSSSDGSLRTFLDNLPASSKNRFRVHIAAGTYDVSQWLNQTELEGGNSTNVGLTVPDYVTIIGTSPTNCIFVLEFEERSQYVSVINFKNTSGAENIQFFGTKTRYVCHDDFASTNLGGYDRYLKNCIFKGGGGLYYSAAYGCGVKNGARYTIENCEFEGQEGFLWHTGKDFTEMAELTMINCSMRATSNSNGITIRAVGSDSAKKLKNRVHLYGCYTNGYAFIEDPNAYYTGLDFVVDGYGNTKNVPITIDSSDSADDNWAPNFRDGV